MNVSRWLRLVRCAVVVAVFCGWNLTGSAQLIRAPLDSGFSRTSTVAMTVDEMLGSQKTRSDEQPILGPGYPALWIAEVQYKPVRYVRMEVTDPVTGETKPELVWYMVYRVIPRDYTELAGDSRDELLRKLDDPNRQPVNNVDEVVGLPLLRPRFVLHIDDSGEEKDYADEVNRQIQQKVFLREFRERAAGLTLVNSVEAIQEVGEPVSVLDDDQLRSAVYGVAVWRNVDPKTDYFSVMMSGFTNAYRISRDAAGEMLVEEKVVVQRFGRPGDEFLQDESEFRFIDSAGIRPNGDLVLEIEGTGSVFPPGRPEPAFVSELRERLFSQDAAGGSQQLSWPTWEYRPRTANLTVPAFEAILRNAKR
ncbi:MAG: hypothetical protein KDA89_23145 [Planctomycetaceae bacterium]|nr:hypothetical protein [Planctomycetaceae bacterium]